MALEYKDPCAGPIGVIDISLFGLLAGVSAVVGYMRAARPEDR
jgi:hypothetical protein